MVRNPEKLELATHYRKRGYSYSEIAKICGVSKATVSNWLGHKAFSRRVKADNIKKAARENMRRMSIVNKVRASEREKRYQEAIKTSNNEFKHYSRDPLFIAALAIYLASGDRTDPARVRLTSREPLEHQLFIRFLQTFGGVSKSEIKHWVILPVDTTGEGRILSLWSRRIGLAKSQFGKSQFLSHNKKAPLHISTGNTIIASTVLKRKLMRWLELLLKELKAK